MDDQMDEQASEQLQKLLTHIFIIWVIPKLLKTSVYFGMKEPSYIVSGVILHNIIPWHIVERLNSFHFSENIALLF